MRDENSYYCYEIRNAITKELYDILIARTSVEAKQIWESIVTGANIPMYMKDLANIKITAKRLSPKRAMEISYV